MQLPYHLPEFQVRPRVQSGRGLIHDQKLRVVDQSPGQTEPLLHSAGQPVYKSIHALSQPYLFQKTSGAFSCFKALQMIAGRKKFHIFRHL